ncbi:MAG: hypothetical protein V1924_06470 [Candidatus Bathyarchaeota archaeon]
MSVVMAEPDPTAPDPVAYWRAWTRLLQEQARRYESPPLTRWMELEKHG